MHRVLRCGDAVSRGGIGHRRCGKFIVATLPDQLAKLHAIQDRARANGVHDLVLLDAAEPRPQSPRCSVWRRCTRHPPALWTAMA